MTSLQLSWTFSGKTLSIRLAISRAAFVLRVDHPFMGFLWHLSQGSPKALAHIDPLAICEISARPSARPYSGLHQTVLEGLRVHSPEACEEGVNGTYFLKDFGGKMVGVFKPADEEGDSRENPKRQEEPLGDFVQRGVPEGEGALREVAAFLLDFGGFSGVPETEMVTLEHEIWGKEKTGSLQRFVENDGSSADIGPGRFPTREVHKIGVLDLRIFNTDRHDGNILFREKENGELELVPIDHGLSLPSKLNRAWFEWMNWPQAKRPFDEETRKYIDAIDVAADAKLLRELGIGEESIRTMVMSTTLLKKGAAAGLTLYEIARIVCREDLEEPCEFEMMFERAVAEANGKDDEIIPAMERIMDEEIAKRCE